MKPSRPSCNTFPSTERARRDAEVFQRLDAADRHVGRCADLSVGQPPGLPDAVLDLRHATLHLQQDRAERHPSASRARVATACPTDGQRRPLPAAASCRSDHRQRRFALLVDAYGRLRARRYGYVGRRRGLPHFLRHPLQRHRGARRSRLLLSDRHLRQRKPALCSGALVRLQTRLHTPPVTSVHGLRHPSVCARIAAHYGQRAPHVVLPVGLFAVHRHVGHRSLPHRARRRESEGGSGAAPRLARAVRGAIPHRTVHRPSLR